MPEITGIIKAKSQYGVKMTDDGDWWNWSKPEYRGQPFDTKVVAGDTVHVEYAEADSGKVYISTIGKVTGGPLPAEFDESGELVDDIPGVPAPTPPVPGQVGQPTSQREWGYRERDILMARTSCIKSAVAIYGPCIEKGVAGYPAEGVILAYADALYKWCLEAVE